MEPRTRSELRTALLFGAAVAALALVALAYRPALDAGFIWDDHLLAERDAPFRHVPIFKLFTSGFWPASPLSEVRPHYYRPVVLLSLRADLALGDDASGFHFTNLLLHLSACVLVAVVAVRAGARVEAGIVAALVWGLMPRLSESVAWIAGRTDVLATMFGLGALALSSALDRPDRGPRRSREIASACALFLALASKEVALAFAVGSVAAHLKRRSWREARSSLGVEAFAPVALWIVLRVFALGESEQPLRDLGSWQRVGTVFEAAERYVEMTFDALRPRTSIGLVGDIDGARAAVGAVLVLLLLALLVHVNRRGGIGARLGITVAATAIAPVLHVIPFALSGAVVADRLLYAPLAGLAIALATGASAATSSRKWLAVAALVVALFFGAATRARVGDYANEGRFWLVAAQHAHPGNPMPLRALAATAESADEVELACRLFERARERANVVATVGAPAYRRTIEALAACWIKLGRYDEGRALLEDLAHAYPTHGRVWVGLGYAREHTLDFDGAAFAFGRAEAIDAALAPLIGEATGKLTRSRSAAERFSEPTARAADPIGYADFLADIGHAPEAEAAYVASVQDVRLRADQRNAAGFFVIEHGRLPRAEQVVAERPWLLNHHLQARRRRHAKLEPLVPAIEELLSRRP